MLASPGPQSLGFNKNLARVVANVVDSKKLVLNWVEE